MSRKEDLIIVHSFPTNSVILRGFIEYLEQFFRVHFIDLPGFHKDVKPLEKISLKNYSHYVQKKIEEMKLKSYYIAGISFGFRVVSECAFDKKCKAVLAMEPWINYRATKMGWLRRNLLRLVGKVILITGTHKRLWNKRTMYFLKNRLGFFEKHDDEKINMLVENIDSRTFFETGLIILKQNGMPRFNHEVPYVLAINDKDESINTDYIESVFSRKLDVLLIVKTSVSHYPEMITKEYFDERIPRNCMKAGFGFVDLFYRHKK
jgi:pimeloyl-ACP methyl ester carboxylesterase